LNFGSDIPTHTSLGRWVISVIATSITKSNQCTENTTINNNNNNCDKLMINDFEWNYNLVINYFKDFLNNKSTNTKKGVEQGITLACNTGSFYIVTVVEDMGTIYHYILY
jgi:hypothetical protein